MRCVRRHTGRPVEAAHPAIRCGFRTLAGAELPAGDEELGFMSGDLKTLEEPCLRSIEIGVHGKAALLQRALFKRCKHRRGDTHASKDLERDEAIGDEPFSSLMLLDPIN